MTSEERKEKKKKGGCHCMLNPNLSVCLCLCVCCNAATQRDAFPAALHTQTNRQTDRWEKDRARQVHCSTGHNTQHTQHTRVPIATNHALC